MRPVLFPHSYIHEPQLRKLLKIFDSLTVCLPWEMELPDFMTSDNSIKTLYPPADLKPPDKIQSLLSEYRKWMKQNLDKSYLEIIRAKQGNESASWEIRKTLGSMMSETKQHLDNNNSLPWHMILHMAREIEEQSVEAEGLLNSLKRKSPLLDGSIESVDNLYGFLDDLPRFTPEAEFSEDNVSKIIDAWFGLFENNLRTTDILLTNSKPIVEYLCEKYSKFEQGINIQNQQTIHFYVPLSPAETAESTITEKTVPLTITHIKETILKISQDRGQSLPNLENYSDTSGDTETDITSEERLGMALTYFHSLPNMNLLKTESYLKYFNNRIILLIKE